MQQTSICRADPSSLNMKGGQGKSGDIYVIGTRCRRPQRCRASLPRARAQLPSRFRWIQRSIVQLPPASLEASRPSPRYVRHGCGLMSSRRTVSGQSATVLTPLQCTRQHCKASRQLAACEGSGAERPPKTAEAPINSIVTGCYFV